MYVLVPALASTDHAIPGALEAPVNLYRSLKWPLCGVCSKASPAAVHIMEGALRWGVEHIFSHQHYITEHSQGTPAATPSPNARDHDLKMEDAASPQGPSHPAREAGTAGAEATPSPRRRTTPASASPEPGMQSPFGAPEQQQQPKSHSKPRNRNSGSVFQPVYTDTVLEKVLEWSMALSRAAKAWAHGSEGVNDDKASSGVGGAAQSLGEVLGADWSCVKLHEWSQSQLDDDTQADEGGCFSLHAELPTPILQLIRLDVKAQCGWLHHRAVLW